ncbi:acyl-CoA dehydrogenase family protein [Mycolicibacterium arenosum]|uniref:Acyl-CoA/acyl-ACP dehydrogenase n=1 Tax=Mycolicibacterium arenosum TaxID=2952157 RepID=A0ABT1M763_9MYCO|nr:acyl-CoA dehydrogenase family protein [Mycolicibacterium sp. CAU 1645]MCP9273642.1 acyl-CoA/acyl-ACP dehydrogenase [Mycolicibacterium sp. CAU 1645]
MQLLPDDDERDFAATLRRLFAVDRDDTGVWNSLAEAGVLGLVLPECHGGSGGRLRDLGVFFVEAGRGLCPTLVHGTIQAGMAIDALGTAEQRTNLLPALASGKSRATTALWSPVDASRITPTLRAEPTGAAWVLSGCVDFVLDADSADAVVVSAGDTATGHHLVAVVPADSRGLRADPVTLMGGQTAARLHFDGVTVDQSLVLGADHGVSDERLRWLANTATTLLSLDLVGVGEAALQRTVDYTVMRQQFGRPIASFQAAQHLVANMHIALAAARLAARAAVSVLETGEVATRETAVARMRSAGAAKLITLDAHQLHGGMGYVVDTDLHRYSERARVLSTLGGGADIAATWLEMDG